MIRFFLSNNPASLLVVAPHVTIEAEYGDTVVEGSILTMAHHGPRKGQKAPCAYDNGCVVLPYGDTLRVGLSHVDLDTIGGCMAVLDQKPYDPEFWGLAEFVDLNGPHKIYTYRGERGGAFDRMYAFWAYSQNHRVYPPRDGSVLDVTGHVLMMAGAVQRICDLDPDLLQEGHVFETRETSLERQSFVSFEGGVVLRESTSFCNHLYEHDGEFAVACVGYNPKEGSVTLSYADGVPPGAPTARELVQEMWGPLAGGHDGIAGSPRDTSLPRTEVERLVERVREVLAS